MSRPVSCRERDLRRGKQSNRTDKPMKRTHSPKQHGRKQTAFTLVEIMIVVAVMGLIGAIAVPNFMTARQESQAETCTIMLEKIAGAKIQVAFAENMGDTDTPTDAQLSGYLKDGEVMVIEGSTALCPAGGTYAVNDISTNPTCSLAEAPRQHQME